VSLCRSLPGKFNPCLSVLQAKVLAMLRCGVLGVDLCFSGSTAIRCLLLVQSKFVAEILMEEACARGLPVFRYRAGNVSAQSSTGAFSSTMFLSVLLCRCIWVYGLPVACRSDNVCVVL
jgi:hypothetical protein